MLGEYTMTAPTMADAAKIPLVRRIDVRASDLDLRTTEEKTKQRRLDYLTGGVGVFAGAVLAYLLARRKEP